MSSHVALTGDGVGTTGYSQEVVDSHAGTQVDPRYESRSGIQDDEHSAASKDHSGSRTSWKESAATAVGDDQTSKPTERIHKVETVREGEIHPVHDHPTGFADTIKYATHSAKRKIYVHHRSKRALSKQLTANSASKHLEANGRRSDEEMATYNSEASTSSPSVWQTLLIMVTTFPYWNMAFWSGWCYSIGSAMFVIDSLWGWIPLQWPGHEFKNQEEYAVPLMFFFGACLYQIGGVMAYLEAVNDGSFAGAAMKRLLEGHDDIERELLDAKLHTFFGHLVPHHHHDDEEDEKFDHTNEDDGLEAWKTLTKTDSSSKAVYNEAKKRVERRGGVDQGPSEKGQVREYLTWRWWPTWHALRTYHIFELGYVSCTIQLFGVTLYGVTSVVILPGIFDSLAWWQKLAAYWVPQLVASCCFLFASVMFTIMAQDAWNKPKIGAVSWWIGIWAQVGSVGFLLIAIFGVVGHEHTWGEYQSGLAGVWGSFFYMLSGLFQWYEAINVNAGPVLAFPNNRTPVLFRKTP